MERFDVQLENHFTVQAPISDVWEVFEDIPRVASCMPGATLTSSDGDQHEGKVTVRLGPMKVTYQGQATVTELDETAHRARLVGQGRDVKGGGKARADVQMVATEGPDGTTEVAITTDLDITGRVAQFGRGVLQDVSSAIVDDFAARLSEEIRREPDVATVDASEPPPDAATPVATAGPRSTGQPAASDDAMDAGALIAVVMRRPAVAFGVGVVVGLLLSRCARRRP